METGRKVERGGRMMETEKEGERQIYIYRVKQIKREKGREGGKEKGE